MALLMSMFLFSLAGVPPFAGWFAKLTMFRAALDANTPGATVLGAIAAVSSVIAFFYYARVAREMWFHPVPEGIDATPDALAGRARTRRSASAASSCSWSACTRSSSPGSVSSPPAAEPPAGPHR